MRPLPMKKDVNKKDMSIVPEYHSEYCQNHQLLTRD